MDLLTGRPVEHRDHELEIVGDLLVLHVVGPSGNLTTPPLGGESIPVDSIQTRDPTFTPPLSLRLRIEEALPEAGSTTIVTLLRF